MITKLNSVLRMIPTWVVYLALIAPGAVYFYWALINQLGADPILRLERQYGRWALQLLIAGLLVSPVRKLLGVNLMKFRRAIGLMAFLYVALHLLIWVMLDKWLNWAGIWEDIVKRPFMTIGMMAFLMLVPLAVTSNNLSVRRMGAAAWRKLHRLTYFAALAGAVHYMLIVKGWPMEPIMYVAVVAGLVAWRLPVGKWIRQGQKHGAPVRHQS